MAEVEKDEEHGGLNLKGKKKTKKNSYYGNYYVLKSKYHGKLMNSVSQQSH